MGLKETTSGHDATGLDYVKGTEAEFDTFTGDLTGDVTGDVTGYRGKVIEARTATADGTGTGQISASVDWVNVTATNAAHIITLPAPVIGTEIWLMNGDTGYELRTSAPATIAINGGSGENAESAVAASVLVRVICTSLTTWVATKFVAAGTESALEAAA